MRSRLSSGVVIVCLCTICTPAVRAQQLTSWEVLALLNRADKLSLALKGDEAKVLVTTALAFATIHEDRIGIAMAHRQMGLVFARLGSAGEGADWYAKALLEFEALGNVEGTVQSLDGLITAALSIGDTAKAREYGNRALKLLDVAKDDRTRSRLLGSLITSGVDSSRNEAWNDEILEIANRLGDDLLRARVFARQGAREFSAANYVAARTSFERAIEGYEKVGDIESLAASYLSLGRVFRAHGDYEGALQRYQKAIDLLAPTGERYTIVEATNAKAIALGYLNRKNEAMNAYRKGLELARESKNPQLIDFMEGNLAGGLLALDRYDEAIPLLQSVIARKPSPYVLSFRYVQLAGALLHSGKTSEALPLITDAIALRRELKMPVELSSDLLDRAAMLSSLGRFDEALADARESLGLIEQIRKTVLPADFLKRGFNEKLNDGYVFVVDLLSRLGHDAEALEVAEQGRSRAFLDLLAARETTVATRGSDNGSPDLSSELIGQPLGLDGISNTAARLKSTILNYWVADQSILIWVVPPTGTPFHVRVPVKRAEIAAQVAKTTAAFRASPAAGPETRGADTAASPSADDDLTALPLRGLGVMALSRDDKSAWRDLYKTLIEPVRARLPRAGRLTIVPHGPLFQLSFAGLQSAAGRYLIEDYELTYAPSISVLEFTAHRQDAIRGNASAPWAVVGNPASLPTVGAKPLPPLPGAAQEIDSIAKLTAGTLRLEGARADEAELQRMLETAHPSVLHFATHGFVFDDQKQPPFLALNKRGTQTGEDGRLTLDEVYRLRLSTDLVVLSACRSGSGQVSSDGVIGLTRGFFYAGSPSVVATFWDVTDQATENLMSTFYRQYLKTHAKGASLRSAQLALLSDLRAGKIVVIANGRQITLPEHPLLWAAFFLSGEP